MTIKEKEEKEEQLAKTLGEMQTLKQDLDYQVRILNSETKISKAPSREQPFGPEN